MFNKISSGPGIDVEYFPGNTGSEFKVFKMTNGNSSNDVFQDVHVGLSYDVLNVLHWANNKMEQEKKLDELCEKHPGLKECRTSFEVMRKLCEE